MRQKTVAAAVAAAMLSVIYPASAAVITGKVVDASTDEPMEFVNVTVSDKSSGKELPVGTMSGVDGAFKLSGVPSGSYNVKLSFVGYKPALVDAVINSGNQSLYLDVVELGEDSHVLDEIEVVGTKSQMRFELDKKVFNVDQNIAAAGASFRAVIVIDGTGKIGNGHISYNTGLGDTWFIGSKEIINIKGKLTVIIASI